MIITNSATSKQYTRMFLLSAVYNLLSHLVFRITPGGQAAYRDQEDENGASLVSVYDQLNGLETRAAGCTGALQHHRAGAVERAGGWQV